MRACSGPRARGKDAVDARSLFEEKHVRDGTLPHFKSCQVEKRVLVLLVGVRLIEEPRVRKMPAHVGEHLVRALDEKLLVRADRKIIKVGAEKYRYSFLVVHDRAIEKVGEQDLLYDLHINRVHGWRAYHNQPSPSCRPALQM